MGSEALQGRGILVTRPRAQAARLARLIEEQGGRAVLFPAIEIEDVAPPPALRRLEDYDLAIFVSPTAVIKVMERLPAWPAGLRAAGVGAGTRRELENFGVRGIVAPEHGADSEALLALAPLQQVSGKRIVIFRGEGGRALLGDTLAARGAQVDYATCYRRARPRARAPQWQPGEIAAVTVSSGEGLANLFELVEAEFLRTTPLFVPHARIAEQARALSVREVQIAGPSDEEMVNRLVAYFPPHG